MHIRLTIHIETGEDAEMTEGAATSYFIGQYGDASPLIGRDPAEHVEAVILDELQSGLLAENEHMDLWNITSSTCEVVG